MSLLERRGFWTLFMGPAVIVYGLYMVLVGGFRVEHGFILAIWVALCYIPRVQWATKLIMPFFLQALFYDGLRFITPFFHGINPPHVEGPYRIEQALFGLTQADGTVITLPEFFLTHNHIVADLIAGFAYAGYMYVHMALAIYLLFKDREHMRRFGWAFLLCICASFVIYYLYPAAPPWYVVENGLGPAILDTPGSPARLVDVDAAIGFTYFGGMYDRNSNVFAAIPSMHPIYPMMAWFYARKHFPRVSWGILAFVLLIGVSAVYLCHHYIIDVLLGMALGTASYFGAEAIMNWQARRAAEPAAEPASRTVASH